MSQITPAMVAEHGLTAEEYDNRARHPRPATQPHRTRHLLGDVVGALLLQILQEMAEDPADRRTAGDLRPGRECRRGRYRRRQAAVFKIESHNHPSFIEPYQGAATGVGGILRDVFTMGARPVANLNACASARPTIPRPSIWSPASSPGSAATATASACPRSAARRNFHRAYNGNILVNAMTVGIADADRIFYSAAAGPGNPVVYVGSKTGRDGIHGATMASAEFSEDSEEKRPTVQVGDPFTEKLLLEACLELMATDAIVAIQDMGAAGLTSSSVEMASKGGVGDRSRPRQVPMREDGMTAYELMLSESQERMLMVLKPGQRTPRGRSSRNGNSISRSSAGSPTPAGWCCMKAAIEADIPSTRWSARRPNTTARGSRRPAGAIARPISRRPTTRSPRSNSDGDPDLCSRRWIWEQYDHMVMADTVRGPGGDAAVVRVHGTQRGLAVTTDSTPRYCLADPERGGRQAVAEAWRNLVATGATPLAITNNLNFGNPERPADHGPVRRLRPRHGRSGGGARLPGRLRQCLALQRNRGRGDPAHPGHRRARPAGRYRQGDPNRLHAPDRAIILLGETTGWLGASVYLRDILGREDGAPPPVDLAAERRNGSLILDLVDRGLVKICHDIADGGLSSLSRKWRLPGGSALRSSLQRRPTPSCVVVRRGSEPLYCRGGRSGGNPRRR